MSGIFEDEDVKCPRCSWTLLTGGMTEDAHEAVCGPIPGRESMEDMFSRTIDTSSELLPDLQGSDAFVKAGERPPYDIGANPMPQLGTGPGPAGSSSACKLFQFVFSLSTDFGEDGVLKSEEIRKEITEANIPSAIDQPRGSIEDAVHSLANELAQKVKTSGSEEQGTFEQFSGTFLVHVVP